MPFQSLPKFIEYFRAAALSLVLPAALTLVLPAALSLSGCRGDPNDDIALVAVATNFKTTFETLEAAFEAETDFDVTQVNGSSGSLYTKIINGAPYHAFLSADQWRPQQLEQKDVASRRFTYAKGALVLWSKTDKLTPLSTLDLLGDPAVKPIAIANPALAPYGAAAQQTFASLNLSPRRRLVVGENVGQAFALVQSGNARIGLVAKSDAQRFQERSQGGSYTVIDPALYAPIRQDAVLLNNGDNHDAAKAFFAFLQSPTAQNIIQSGGYQLDTSLN